jgi:hypothetical protein
VTADATTILCGCQPVAAQTTKNSHAVAINAPAHTHDTERRHKLFHPLTITRSSIGKATAWSQSSNFTATISSASLGSLYRWTDGAGHIGFDVDDAAPEEELCHGRLLSAVIMAPTTIPRPALIQIEMIATAGTNHLLM